MDFFLPRGDFFVVGCVTIPCRTLTRVMYSQTDESSLDVRGRRWNKQTSRNNRLDASDPLVLRSAVNCLKETP